MPTIKVERPNDVNNAASSFRFFINKMEMGTIVNGETKEFTVPEGQHTVMLKTTLMRSPGYTFYIKDNETKSFKVSAHKNAKWIIWLIVLLIAVRIGFRFMFASTGSYYSSGGVFISLALLGIYLYIRRGTSYLSLIEVPTV